MKRTSWSFRELRRAFAAAQPFPHIVMDDFLSEPAYRAAARAFPGPNSPMWHRFRSGTQNRKLQSTDLSTVGPALGTLLARANRAPFLRFLEGATGIAGLLPDPEYVGGGLHQTLAGGHLSMHVDYNYHPRYRWDRRLNAILYLNEQWEDDWGGHLELWDRDVATCVRRIAPVGNRLVVFATDERSWHGHPAPLTPPPGVTRRSLAAYYYTHGRPEEERADEHSTVFRPRPGERFQPTLRDRASRAARVLGLT